MPTPMITSEDLFCNLISAEIEEKDPDPKHLVESYKGEFTENAKAVAKVALEKGYIEREGHIQEAVIAGVNRLRDFELRNGAQAAREAGTTDSTDEASKASCDDAAYWKRVALWMADAHVKNLQAAQQSCTCKSESERLQTLVFECLSAIRGSLVEHDYKRDAYEVVQSLHAVAAKLQ